VTASTACPRCLWERTVTSAEAPITIAIAMRAHYEVWHPTFDPPAPSIVPLSPERPRSRSHRHGATRVAAASAAL
jgi:hypothetical protein